MTTASRREVALFTLAVALIGLHVVDDSFVQPQPGMSAGDHVASGLIPLAILGLAAWAYPRVRAGARGTIALVLVLPALLSGAEAIYYAGKTGLDGDDYTGLLAMGAAPILLGLGVWTLWGSRRLGDRLVRRYGRRVLKVAGVLVVLFILALPLSIADIGSHVSLAEVPRARLGAAHEDVTQRTSDGLRSRAGTSRRATAPRSSSSRAGRAPRGRRGCSFAMAMACCSTTAGARAAARAIPNTWGWDLDKDIRAGLDFIARRADVDPRRIGGLGLSVGGEMMLQTAADTKALAAVVSEGAGARTMAEEVDDVDGLDKVGNALSYGGRDLVNSVLQNRLPPENLVKLIPRISPRLVLLIHGGADDAGHRNADYFRAARQPKQIWEARGGHTDGISEQPREYERRVVDFLDAALLRARG